MSDDVCIICQEQGTLQNYIIENKNCKCKYYYHETCFPPSRRKKCPMCAKEIAQPLQLEHSHVEIRIPTAPPASQSVVPPVYLPNQIPLLSSQPPIIRTPRVQINKQKLAGCICASMVVTAIVAVLILIGEHGG